MTELSPTLSALLPLAAVVFATTVGVVVARILKPSELLSENRSLRSEVDAVRDRMSKLEELVSELRIYRTVVDILLPHLDAIIPNLTSSERETVDEARRLRNLNRSDT